MGIVKKAPGTSRRLQIEKKKNVRVNCNHMLSFDDVDFSVFFF